jgi:hypothetical protein
MNKPFQLLMDSDLYLLRRVWGREIVDITKNINDTFLQYGEDGVSDREFNKLVTRLTKNSKNNTSVIQYRSDPEIISELCRSFPSHFNTKNMDQLISCFTKEKYPMNCIESIINSGYKFTDSQISALTALGYPMYTLTEGMSYSDFLLLFSSAEFLYYKELNDGMNVPELSQQNLNHKVSIIRDLCSKYKFTLWCDFISAWVKSLRNTPLDTIINIHKIAKVLNIKFENSTIIGIIDRDEIFDDEANMINYGVKLKSIDGEDIIATFDYDRFKILLNYYDTFVIDRSMILERISSAVFTKLIHPSITKYNQFSDIFYILSSLSNTPYHPTRDEFVAHLITHNYLENHGFDFIVYLLSLGLVSDKNILKECITVHNVLTFEQYIENFYTFAQADVLNLLSEHKIIPTSQNILLCSSCSQLEEIYNNSIFIDDDMEKYIRMMIDYTNMYDGEYCERYDGEYCERNNQYIANGCYTYEDNIMKTKNGSVLAVGNIDHIDYFLNIYDSLSERDKSIFEHIDINKIFWVSTIIKYGLTITDEYLKHMIMRGYWKTLLLLLHVSNVYDYLIEMIDINIVTFAPSIISRQWLMNNILNSDICSFTLPNKHFDSRINVQNDVNRLMKNPVLNIIEEMRSKLIAYRNNTKRDILIYKMTHESINTIVPKKECKVPPANVVELPIVVQPPQPVGVALQLPNLLNNRVLDYGDYDSESDD